MVMTLNFVLDNVGCKEVMKIYRDCSHHLKIALYHTITDITIIYYITQHPYCVEKYFHITFLRI